MRKKLIIIALAIVSAIIITGCGSYKQSISNNLMSQLRARFQIVRGPQQTFYDLNNTRVRYKIIG